MKENNDLRFILSRVNEAGGASRLGVVFETKNNGYFYDNGTGKVLCCESDEFLFFKWLFSKDNDSNCEKLSEIMDDSRFDDVINKIRAMIEKENLLQAPKITEFISANHKENLETTLDNDLHLITLELTEKCNLRCGYCIYNDAYDGTRNFSSGEMSIDTLKSAIEMLSKHGGKKVSVTFYGGEPLLKFELIKFGVEYAQQLMKEKELSFSMTSNMTLMTKEMAEFFTSVDRFNIVCSIDGPEYIHNQYRKYPNGNGSFHDALRGLKHIADLTEKDKLSSKISFSIVFTPPYSQERIKDIQSFFEGIDWLPNDISKNVSYTTRGTLKHCDAHSDTHVVYDKALNYDPLLDWTKAEFDNHIDMKELFTKQVSDNVLLGVHNRAICDEPVQPHGLNGCCVPGVERMYICANGDILPCERMGICPPIGNVSTGIDKQRIKDIYVNDYEEKSIKDCNDCWAFKICRICYTKIYTEDSLDIEKKRQECIAARDSALRALIYYHSFMEVDPELLSYLNDFVIS